MNADINVVIPQGKSVTDVKQIHVIFKSSAIDDEIELHILWININYVEILILVPRDERYGITS